MKDEKVIYDRVPGSNLGYNLKGKWVAPGASSLYFDGMQIVFISKLNNINIRVMKGNNVVLDGFKGSLGQITAVAAKDGDRILKGKITNMTNPNTVKQQGIRSNFTVLAKLGSAINLFLKLYFLPVKVLHSPYNSFVSLNAPKRDAATGLTPSLDFDIIQYTNGNLYSDLITSEAGSFSDEGDGTADLTLSWAYDPDSSLYDGTDELFVLYLNAETYSYSFLNIGAERSEAGRTISFSLPTSGDLYIVPFFVNISTNDCSSAVAVGKVSSSGIYTGI